MTPDDVQRSYHSGTHGLPMCNAKVYARPDEDTVRAACEDQGEPDAFPYVYALLTGDDPVHEATRETLWRWASESAWETLQERADETLPGVPRVFSAGRCGGWAVVKGLPCLYDEPDAWDDDLLRAWDDFCQQVRNIADDMPYQMATSAVLNMWPAEQLRQTREGARYAHG